MANPLEKLGETLRAATLGRKLSGITDNPISAVTNPQTAIDTLNEGARNANNSILQEGLANKAKETGQQALNRVKDILPKEASPLLDEAEKTMIKGVDNIAAFIKNAGLDEAIASIAKSFNGITLDQKAYAAGIPDSANTLDKAPDGIKKINENMATAAPNSVMAK